MAELARSLAQGPVISRQTSRNVSHFTTVDRVAATVDFGGEVHHGVVDTDHWKRVVCHWSSQKHFSRHTDHRSHDTKREAVGGCDTFTTRQD